MQRFTRDRLLLAIVLGAFLMTSGGRTQEVEKKKPAQTVPAAKKPDGKPPAAPAEKPAAPSPDERAIRDAAKAFVEAFDRGDAQAVAAHWTTDGEYIDEEGERFVGRNAIQREYETFFKQNPGAKMRLSIDSIRQLTADTALEDGHVVIGQRASGVPPTMSHYSAIHVRQNGRWLMTSVRDSRIDVAPENGRLQDLEPLVGAWSASTKDTRLDVTCRWIADKSFLERSHTVTESGRTVSSGVDIVGIDPATQQITSWSFVSGGGHAVGLWFPVDNGWRIETVGLLPDGTPTSSVNLVRRVDASTLGWKSDQRAVGSVFLPDMPELFLKRK